MLAMKTVYQIVLAFLMLCHYSTSQIPCIRNTVACNADKTGYVRCPATGVFTTPPPMMQLIINCKTTERCIDLVTSGNPGTGDTGFTTGPCVPTPCTSVGFFPIGGPTRVDACGLYYFCDPAGIPPAQGMVTTTPPVPYIKILNCENGGHWSATTNNCARPEVALCNPTLATSAATSTSTATPTPSATATSAATATPTATATSAVTAPLCSGFGRFTDPRSCRHFYRCGLLSSRGKRVRCPFRLRYDEIEQRCTKNAVCGSRPLN